MSKKRDELAEKFLSTFSDTSLELAHVPSLIPMCFKAGWDARDAEVKRIREALEFYANPNFETSKGNRARQALEKLKGTK